MSEVEIEARRVLEEGVVGATDAHWFADAVAQGRALVRRKEAFGARRMMTTDAVSWPRRIWGRLRWRSRAG